MLNQLWVECLAGLNSKQSHMKTRCWGRFGAGVGPVLGGVLDQFWAGVGPVLGWFWAGVESSASAEQRSLCPRGGGMRCMRVRNNHRARPLNLKGCSGPLAREGLRKSKNWMCFEMELLRGGSRWEEIASEMLDNRFRLRQKKF